MALLSLSLKTFCNEQDYDIKKLKSKEDINIQGKELLESGETIMEEILKDLGYEPHSNGNVKLNYYKQYNKCSIYVDLNNSTILMSTDNKGVKAVKRYSTKLHTYDKEIIESVLYAKIKPYLEESEEL